MLFTSVSMALEWTSIDEHWAISCADADVAFAVGNAGINAASPFTCLRCRITSGFFVKASAFLVFGFVGVAGGSGIGPGWSCPYIYRHIRYKHYSCHIAIGPRDFRLFTSNGVSVLLYLSHI